MKLHNPNDFRRFIGCMAIALCLAASAGAELTPDWISRLPAGSALGSGIAGFAVDETGVSYVTGTAGPSSNTDVLTAAFGPDGALLWSQTFNGPENWHDQGRGIALGPGGIVYVTGNTPSARRDADVLVLAYDATTGNLLDTIQYSSAPFKSEHGASVAVNSASEIFVVGGTVGDGGDAMILKFTATGTLAWRRVWDGPAAAPFSQDTGLKILLDPNGDPVVMINGVMSSLHPDFVAVKYAADDGATVWETTWGVTGEDSPTDMKIDLAGDVFMTGVGLDVIDKYSTIRLRGNDGALLWQAYDSAAFHNVARALTLDGDSGVYITGSVDPDGDESNFNDDIYTVKRDAVTGGQLWSHRYGASCVGCFDAPGDVKVDPSGNVFVAAVTSSPPQVLDVILLVLDEATGIERERGFVAGPSDESLGTGFLRFDDAYNLFDGGEVYNVNTGSIDLSVTRWASLVGDHVLPESFTAQGDLLGGTLAELLASDDERVVIRSRPLFARSGDPAVSITVEGTTSLLSPTRLRFTYEGQASVPGVAQRIYLFNYAINDFVAIGEQPATSGDSTASVVVDSNAGDFVGSDGRLRARIGLVPSGPGFFTVWVQRVDRTAWGVTP